MMIVIEDDDDVNCLDVCVSSKGDTTHKTTQHNTTIDHLQFLCEGEGDKK